MRSWLRREGEREARGGKSHPFLHTHKYRAGPSTKPSRPSEMSVCRPPVRSASNRLENSLMSIIEATLVFRLLLTEGRSHPDDGHV
mmetsp:Transcript_5681/g.13544  ORF Transcript_5681/g.13544 Transcript_5681/m.13544 type:complete len:86 (-) Transcript_5681:245-502(-)